MPYDDHWEDVRQQRLKAEHEEREIELKISRFKVELDPPLDIFNVEVCGSGRMWTYTAGSEAGLRIFLEGLKAGVGIMGGYLTVPEIPREPAVVTLGV